MSLVIRQASPPSLVGGVMVGLLVSGCGFGTVHSDNTATAPPRLPGSRPVRVYKVPSGSMEPTLPLGTTVGVKEGMPSVGAIVVYHPPEGFEREECGPKPHVLRSGGAACDVPIPREETRSELIKRVVAGPGDEIYVREGHVYRKANGSAAFGRKSEPYIRACGIKPECNFPTPIKIPRGHWFLMGDNRGESNDSRSWGPVPTAWIVGVATAFRRPRF